MRHHERGFAFVIDGSDAPTDTYGLLLRYRSRCRPRQFLSSAVPFENGQDVLRRVRSRRADVPGSLRAGFPEEAPRRRPTGGLGHRTMHVLRLLPLEVGLVEDRPRTRAHRSPSETNPKLAPGEPVTFTHLAPQEDPSNLSPARKALGRFEDLQSVPDLPVRVPIKPSLCRS